MNVQSYKEKGFTIIEVVLVLAIAALIFLMVFIALPALQRSQRDNARKSDITTIAAAVNTYTGGNRGAFPSDDAKLRSYIIDVSENTDVSLLTIAPFTTSPVTVADQQVSVITGAKCGETGTTSQTISKGTKTQYVVITQLEAGGGTSFCQQS